MLFTPGMLVKSKAGRDKGCIYVIIDVNAEYIYLADGVKRPVCQGKKKNRKHLQAIRRNISQPASDDEAIRNVISEYLCLGEKRNSGEPNMQED